MTKLNGLLLGGLLLALTGCQNDRFEDLENEVAMQQLIDTHQHNEIANLNAQLEATQADLLAAETALAAAIADNGTSIVDNAEAIQNNVTVIATNYDILVAADSINLNDTTLTINKLGVDLSIRIEDEVVALNIQLEQLEAELKIAIADGDQIVINNLNTYITNVETQLVNVAQSISNVPTFDPTSLNNAISDLVAADEAIKNDVVTNALAIQNAILDINRNWTLIADNYSALLTKISIGDAMNTLDISALRTEILDLGYATAAELTTEIEQVRLDYAAADAGVQANIDALLNTVNTIESNLNTAIEDNRDLINANTVSNTINTDALNQAVLDAANALATVESELNALIQANETAITGLASQVATLESNLALAENNIASLEAQVIALEANVLITTNALSTVNEGLILAQATIVEINDIIIATASLTTAQIDSLNALIAGLESTIDMLQSEIDQLQFSTVGLTEDEIFALRQPILLALRSTTASADNLQASIVNAEWDDTPSGKSYRVDWEITTPSNRNGFYYAKNASPSITNGLRQMTDEEFFRWVSELQVLLNSLF